MTFNWNQSRLIIWTISYTIGILFTKLFYHYFYGVLMLLAVVILGWFVHRSSRFMIYSIFIFFLIGWTLTSKHLYEIQASSKIAHKLDEKEVGYSGILKAKRSYSKGDILTLEKCQIQFHSNPIELQTKLIIFVPGSCMVAISDTISGFGKFIDLGFVRNPGDFDYRSFYHRKGIFGKILQSKELSPVISNLQTWRLDRQISRMQEWINGRFQRYADSEVSAILTALIIGDGSAIDPNLRNAFETSGVVHVLAVSGLHVGYVLIILAIISSFLRIPWGWDRPMIWLGLLTFVLLTGLKPSVSRAALMAGLYILAPVLNRPVSIFNTIATAALLILFINPLMLYDLGFILSFSAVLSIVSFMKLFEILLPDRFQIQNINSKTIRFIWGLFLVSLSAQLGTLPMIMVYFHKIPIISMAANLIIVPLIGILVGIGFSLIMFSWIPFVGWTLGNSAWLIYLIIKNSAQFFSSVPFSNIPVTGVGALEIIEYCMLLAVFFMVFRKVWIRKAFIVFLILISLEVWSWVYKENRMDVIFIDVGQGDCVFIRFDNGKTMLIDAGIRNRWNDMGQNRVLPVLKSLGINHLNWVVLSHPHTDHIGGFVSILEAVSVDTVWDTQSDYHSWTYNHILGTVKDRGMAYLNPLKGDVFKIGKNTAIEILSPDSLLMNEESNVNDWSIVFRIIHGDVSILFTGDLELDGEEYTYHLGKYLDSDILKVGHHGSLTSTSEKFLSKVVPSMSIISVGERNKFGHPSQEVLQRLEASGSQVRRIDEQGAVWLVSNGKIIMENKWK